MLAYFLKVNIAIALFYAFYRLFFYKDTFFGWRRTALLCFFAVSAAIPLLNVQTWVAEQEPMVAMADLYASVVLPEFNPVPEPSAIGWKELIRKYAALIYWAGVACLAMRFVVQLTEIIRLALRCRTTCINGISVRLLPQPDAPFSFFSWIFVHPASHDEEELNEILTHEQTHAQQWHSLDVIIGELVCIACWFNPFVWLMKREIRTNLEYMADARVLENGYDSKTYQYHLLGLSHSKAAATLYNNFNVLPLKKRIKMMNKKRTKEIGRTKYVMFLPLAALLLTVSNIETVARTTQKLATDMLETVAEHKAAAQQPDAPAATVQQAEATLPQPAQEKKELVTYKGRVIDTAGKPMKGVRVAVDNKHHVEAVRTDSEGKFLLKAPLTGVVFIAEDEEKGISGKSIDGNKLTAQERENLTITMDGIWIPTVPQDPENPIYEVVDEMPVFADNGIEGMMKYLAENIKYPTPARLKGTQGRVTVQFVVDKDGSISDIHVLRGIDPYLDGEAIRVVSTMPRWKPGKHKGEPVKVRYTMPVTFRLQ